MKEATLASLDDIDRRILARLEQEPLPETEEAFAKDLDVSRQTISRHLEKLKEMGYIHGRSVARLHNGSSDKIEGLPIPKAIIVLKINGDTKPIDEMENILSNNIDVSYYSMCAGKTADYIIFFNKDVSTLSYRNFIYALARLRGIHTDTLPVVPRSTKGNLDN